MAEQKKTVGVTLRNIRRATRLGKMLDPFDVDPYPLSPRILFIGIAHSTHTHGWIDLLRGGRLNIRLFAMPSEAPDLQDGTKTYWSLPSTKPQNDLHRYIDDPLAKRGASSGGLQTPGSGEKAFDPSAWLSYIIRDWRPDIIHTLGIFDSQGGWFYHETRKRFGLQDSGTWVVQVRGGSDVALRRYNPETAKQINEIFQECDQIITDNYANIEYIKQLNLGQKIASVAPVPGGGGVDTDVELSDIMAPSRRERVILWPKAYESQWSKALPVMEALTLAWERIKPCKILMMASNLEAETWFWSLPEEIRRVSTIVPRVPQNELLTLMKSARVLLAPSLVDGVPNSLYEAMINGAFPIVSPLDSIMPIVRNEVNVLFARNLYPNEISESLTRAMTDDAMVDQAAVNNFQLVKRIASRRAIAEGLIEYYVRLCTRRTL